MKREANLNEFTDGRKYAANDLVKADCQGCQGCDKCCKEMADSVVLDPYDIARMCEGLQCSFQDLVNRRSVTMGSYEGVILPYLTTVGEDYHCTFLGQEADGERKGRCLIHGWRPGLCRLFPLGRLYENGSFTYILQTQECLNRTRSKIKVEKWVDTRPIRRYDDYIARWHNLILREQKILANLSARAKAPGVTYDTQKQILQEVNHLNMWMLHRYYVTAVPVAEFFERFDDLEAETDSLFHSYEEEA